MRCVAIAEGLPDSFTPSGMAELRRVACSRSSDTQSRSVMT
jgi:hypothetical protein